LNPVLRESRDSNRDSWTLTRCKQSIAQAVATRTDLSIRLPGTFTELGVWRQTRLPAISKIPPGKQPSHLIYPKPTRQPVVPRTKAARMK
jgi:hypothetical protein